MRFRISKDRKLEIDVPVGGPVAIRKPGQTEPDTIPPATFEDIIYEISWLICQGGDAASASTDNERNDDATLLLDALYQLNSQEDSAIDTVIAQFEHWLETDNLLACDKTLAEANVSLLRPTVALAILSMTLVEKDQLPSRRTFFVRTRQMLVANFGEIEANSNLLIAAQSA